MREVSNKLPPDLERIISEGEASAQKQQRRRQKKTPRESRQADDATGDDAAEIQRLAGLSLVDYERERAAAAQRLGIKRLSVLDAVVKAARPARDTGGQGRPIEFAAIEPSPDAIDGAALLTELATAIISYVIVSRAQADAVALWIVFTHAFNNLVRQKNLWAAWGCGRLPRA